MKYGHLRQRASHVRHRGCTQVCLENCRTRCELACFRNCTSDSADCGRTEVECNSEEMHSAIYECDENRVLLSPRAERPPPSDTVATSVPALPHGKHGSSDPPPLGSSPSGRAHRSEPAWGLPVIPRTRRTHAPRVLGACARFDRLTAQRATPCGPRLAELWPFDQRQPFTRTRPLNVHTGQCFCVARVQFTPVNKYNQPAAERN